MKINNPVRKAPVFTHEGAPAAHITPLQELRRTVLSCMLWEDNFYESGQAIALRIKELVPKVPAVIVRALAIEAREQYKLRHAPLLLVREMARGPVTHRQLVAHTLTTIIQRPDEITEFVAIYWKDGRQPLSAQVKKGLAAAFNKFDEYSLAKYDRDGAIKLRDVLFLVCNRPADQIGEPTIKARFYSKDQLEPKLLQRHPGSRLTKLVHGTLPTPDTWEVELSAGKDKKETFERLIREGKLRSLALLRNLRNMEGAGVAKQLVAGALADMRTDRVLPYRFIAAARAVPAWEDIIEPTMLRCAEGRPRISGKTVLLVDVSGSMDANMSQKSDLRRVDAAAGLAILVREVCDDGVIFTFSNGLVPIPPRRGFALRDAVLTSQQHAGTYLGAAVTQAEAAVGSYDRLIVITDEQSADAVPLPRGRGYMINVAAHQRGIGYGAWLHVDGFSEAVLDYVLESENAINELATLDDAAIAKAAQSLN